MADMYREERDTVESAVRKAAEEGNNMIVGDDYDYDNDKGV